MQAKTSLCLILAFLSIVHTKVAGHDGSTSMRRNVRSTRNKRLVDGEIIDIEDAPYVVYLNLGIFECTGVIVSRWNVLTAGHCGWSSYNSSGAFVRSGSNFNDDPIQGDKHLIESFTLHPNFTADSFNKSAKFDIAVIRVKKPFTYDEFTQSIRFYPSKEKLIRPFSEAEVSGFGIHDDDEDLDGWLRRLSSVTIEDAEKCKRLATEHNVPLNEDQGCIMTKNSSQHLCGGDSGGPLVANKYLVGLNIHGGACDTGKKGTTMVFTEISYHQAWIDKYVQYDV